jgi:hypothetical protein
MKITLNKNVYTSFSPRIEDDSIFLKFQLLRKIHEQLTRDLDKYITSGNNLFSTEKNPDDLSLPLLYNSRKKKLTK